MGVERVRRRREEGGREGVIEWVWRLVIALLVDTVWVLQLEGKCRRRGILREDIRWFAIFRVDESFSLGVAVGTRAMSFVD